MRDTIFALASGSLPSGVAVVRISGQQCRIVLETMCNGRTLESGKYLSSLYDPIERVLIDKSLIVVFPGPASYTGEDVVELHVHGGKAVVDAVLSGLAKIDGLRPAKPGEFTYRAFDNGKIDLTQAESIADLIASESENQRRLALSGVQGAARKQIESWSNTLLRMRSLIEAEIDFVEEDDVPGSVSHEVWQDAELLANEIESTLNSAHQGEVVRDGFHLTILGKPNAGKSSLLNCLAKRDAAIVSDQPGTTRDIVEVKLIINGQIVYVSDTAGIRASGDRVEQLGVSRAQEQARKADLNIWLHSAQDTSGIGNESYNVGLVILSKSDLLDDNNDNFDHELFDISISAAKNRGIDRLLDAISTHVDGSILNSSEALFSRKRQVGYLENALELVRKAHRDTDGLIEIRAEYLRSAAVELGYITGYPDNEDILGEIFSSFCVGK